MKTKKVRLTKKELIASILYLKGIYTQQDGDEPITVTRSDVSTSLEEFLLENAQTFQEELPEDFVRVIKYIEDKEENHEEI